MLRLVVNLGTRGFTGACASKGDAERIEGQPWHVRALSWHLTIVKGVSMVQCRRAGHDMTVTR